MAFRIPLSADYCIRTRLTSLAVIEIRIDGIKCWLYRGYHCYHVLQFSFLPGIDTFSRKILLPLFYGLFYGDGIVGMV